MQRENTDSEIGRSSTSNYENEKQKATQPNGENTFTSMQYLNKPSSFSSVSLYRKEQKSENPINALEKQYHDAQNEKMKLFHLQIKSVVDQTVFKDAKTSEQDIISEFNKGKKSIAVEDMTLGTRIDPGHYRLVHRNKRTQIIPYTVKAMRLEVNFTGEQGELGIYKKNDLLIGKYDTFLVNVPQNKIMKAWKNNQAILLGEGSHVIHDPTFKLSESNPENSLVDVTSPIIQHGNITILQIPNGKIAKIWDGMIPYLLESSDQPYVFNSSQIKVELFNGRNFIDASEKIIKHGSKIRVMPHTGEVIYGYRSGELIVFQPRNKPYYLDDATVEIIQEPFSTQIQTLHLPTEKARKERKNQGVTNSLYLNYEVFRTSDFVEIGVNLEVVYYISNPELVLTKFTPQSLENHIEKIVVADMNKLINMTSSSAFQSQVDVKKIKSNEPSAPPEEGYFYQTLQKKIADELVDQLAEIGVTLSRVALDPPELSQDLAKTMANNSTQTAQTMAKMSSLQNDFILAQQAAAREAEKGKIEAENKALLQMIKSDADAKSRVTEAQSKLEAAKMEAEALKIKAQAEADAKKIAATADLEIFQNKLNAELSAQQKRNEIELNYLRQRAELFNQPGYKEVEIAKIQGDAIKGVNQVISPEMFSTMYGGFTNTLFSARVNSGTPQLQVLPGSNQNQTTQASLTNHRNSSNS